jgi:hypothetical protein
MTSSACWTKPESRCRSSTWIKGGWALGTPAIMRPVGARRPYVGPVPPAARPAAFAFKFMPAGGRSLPLAPASPPRPRVIALLPFPGSPAWLLRQSVVRPRATHSAMPASQVLRGPFAPGVPPRPLLFPVAIARPISPRQQPTRAKALANPPPFVPIPPPRLPPVVVVARPIFPATTPRLRRTELPPPAQSPAFTFPFRPLVAPIARALPSRRPGIGDIPPRPRAIVTRRPPATLVVLPPRAPTATPRAVVLQPGRGRPAMVRELQPVLSVRALLAVPVPRPRVLSNLRTITTRPLFLYGPRFTIRDPGSTVSLSDPGVRFTIRDPGVKVQLPLE